MKALLLVGTLKTRKPIKSGQLLLRYLSIHSSNFCRFHQVRTGLKQSAEVLHGCSVPAKFAYQSCCFCRQIHSARCKWFLILFETLLELESGAFGQNLSCRLG
eukprot:jgi/Botrbrau1/11876/Bobra.126_2s0011.1